MKVERQGHNECVLATIAALTETPLWEVRRKACMFAEIALDDWASMMYDAKKFWDVTERVAMFYGGPNMWAMVGPAGRYVPGSSVSEMYLHGMRKLPDKGRGTITFRSKRRGKNKVSHIMPWKDGLIYDPETPKTPMTFRQYRNLRPSMKIWLVTIDN